MSDVYAKLQALQITLPPLAAPAAAYVPYVQTGKLLFISGHLAKKEGKPWVGQLGKDMDTATGQQAARSRHRFARHPARGHRGRPQQGGTHRESDEPGQFCAHLYRAASGH